MNYMQMLPPSSVATLNSFDDLCEDYANRFTYDETGNLLHRDNLSWQEQIGYAAKCMNHMETTGWTMSRVARELGTSYANLHRWCMRGLQFFEEEYNSDLLALIADNAVTEHRNSFVEAFVDANSTNETHDFRARIQALEARVEYLEELLGTFRS